MQKVKFFKGVESELGDLEREVNAWIEESGAKIISINGNIAGHTPRGASTSFNQSDVLVIVHYDS